VTRSTAGKPGPAAGSRPPLFLAGPADLARDLIVLSGPEGRHAADVRRLTVGERAEVTDGAGQLAECVITRVQRGSVELAVRGRRALPAAQPAVVVVQAIPKGDRGQLAVELMTEVGVDVVVPWAAERCIVRWPAERSERALARWRSTAREAAKQARRGWIPEVTGLAGTAEVAARVATSASAIVLDPDAAEPLGRRPQPGSGEIMIIVGPEGGISPAEAGLLAGAGATAAHLGPTVLRASTAGAVAAAVLLSRTGRWA